MFCNVVSALEALSISLLASCCSGLGKLLGLRFCPRLFVSGAKNFSFSVSRAILTVLSNSDMSALLLVTFISFAWSL